MAERIPNGRESSSCRLSAVWKSEIFIISTFPAGIRSRKARTASPLKAYLRSRQLLFGIRAFELVSLHDRNQQGRLAILLVAFAGVPLRNLTFFVSSEPVESIARIPRLTSRFLREFTTTCFSFLTQRFLCIGLMSSSSQQLHFVAAIILLYDYHDSANTLLYIYIFF